MYLEMEKEGPIQSRTALQDQPWEQTQMEQPTNMVFINLN